MTCELALFDVIKPHNEAVTSLDFNASANLLVSGVGGSGEGGIGVVGEWGGLERVGDQDGCMGWVIRKMD